MVEVIGGIVFLALLFVLVALVLYFSLRKLGENCENSNNILNKFEPDNTAPKITDLIEYHKINGKIKYEIESDEK